MEKPDKKEEKQKAGKKMEARKQDAVVGISEQLERAFIKKMKALVKEVKKETKKEIKNIIKEARQKIRVGAAEIVEDLLKNAKTKTGDGNIEIPEQNQAVIAPEPIVVTPPETVDATQSTPASTNSTPKKASSRNRKNTIPPDNKPMASARTRTRKTPASGTGATEPAENDQV